MSNPPQMSPKDQAVFAATRTRTEPYTLSLDSMPYDNVPQGQVTK